MKYIFLGLISSIALVSVSQAKTVTAKREPASVVQCKETAVEAVKFIDKSGWGEVANEPMKVISSKRDQLRNEEFEVKSSVSGFTYKVSITQDYRSEACIVLSVTTD